ncbi:MAG: S-adenosylmethionine:tRNA ribosyltransferase-isomerase [Chryseobacterium sp.]|nr:MAG: S-adenosylmethionine:tRNA ribosyltransferase-isomerase [Chryseobacterium sp.]
MIYKKGEISEDVYRNLPEQLPSDALLVFNNTRVIKSRIFFHKPTGGAIEIFCLEPYNPLPEYAEHFDCKDSVLWKCLIGKANKWKESSLTKTITVNEQTLQLTAEIVERLSDSFLIRFSWDRPVTFGEVLNAAGTTPLPPYIKRVADKEDEETYQTVYSEHEGSVAAPTAGLHFTDNILNELRAKSIPSMYTTLHVGAGTFMPVKSETMEGHNMHSEWMNISRDFLVDLRSNLDKTIISVGTTSARTLESVYRMGNKLCQNPQSTGEELKVSQWESYEESSSADAYNAVSALIDYLDQRKMTHLSIETEIIIAPGYEFKIVKGLLTNFHQPQSTLLLLVSALIGDDWRKVYDYALENNFRFLSYGDGSLLLP